MNTSSAIIIFTKDRPDILFKTLKGIGYTNMTIVVIDDSYLIKNRIINEREITKNPQNIYHGRKEQLILDKKIGVDSNTLKKYSNKLGGKGWNLGYARNQAIILSKSFKLTKVLFMDDDIIVEDPRHIQNIFSLLDEYEFVGSKVTGMIDDSVVGHIVRELGHQPEEYFSGGFIAFKPSVVSEYFINQYNEDWIWIYFHQITNRCHLFGEVKQLPFNKFRNGLKKAKKQEIGELLIDGVKETFEQQNFQGLIKAKLWDKLLLEKQEYYGQLKIVSLQKKQKDFYSILRSVSAYSAKLKSSIFVNIFSDYFNNREEWINILNAL